MGHSWGTKIQETAINIRNKALHLIFSNSYFAGLKTYVFLLKGRKYFLNCPFSAPQKHN